MEPLPKYAVLRDLPDQRERLSRSVEEKWGEVPKQGEPERLGVGLEPRSRAAPLF